MSEIQPMRKHKNYDHEFICKCSNCDYIVSITVNFDEKGNLKKGCFQIKYCPNCGAKIKKFVQYGEKE